MISPPDLRGIASTLRPIEFPSRFAVELCADCNLHCSMCHHPTMKRPKGVMPFPLWQKCADEIASVAPATQTWFSFCGEPLLQPELLLRCLEYGRQVGLRAMCLNTNGMLLDATVAERLLDAGLVQFVGNRNFNQHPGPPGTHIATIPGPADTVNALSEPRSSSSA